MDCNKAGRLMMAYMDKNISKEEELNLSRHVNKCDTCREEFDIYKEMKLDLDGDETPLISSATAFSPDFECAIMGKITKLAERTEMQFKLIFGTYTAVFSFLVVVILLNVNINYRAVASRLSDVVQSILFTFINVLQQVFYQFGSYAFSLQHYAGAILIVLVVLYILVQIKDTIRPRITN